MHYGILLGSRDAVLIGKSHNYKLLDVIRASPWGERKARHWVSVSLPLSVATGLEWMHRCKKKKEELQHAKIMKFCQWWLSCYSLLHTHTHTHTHCLSMMSLNNKESKMAGRGKSMSVSAVQDIYSPVSLTPGPEMPTLHTLWSGIYTRWAVIFPGRKCDVIFILNHPITIYVHT